MSNAVHHTAPSGLWSGPVYQHEASVLHGRYMLYFGEIKKTTIILVSQLQSAAYMNEIEGVLSNGYVPHATAVFRMSRGKVAIVFPAFGDRSLRDGTTTDRSLTIHTTGTIDLEEIIAIVDMFLVSLPKPRSPGSAHDLWPPKEGVAKPNAEWPEAMLPKTCRVDMYV